MAKYEKLRKLTIEIKTDNDAFHLGGCRVMELELASILHKIADKIQRGERPEHLRDLNGNRVGAITYEFE